MKTAKIVIMVAVLFVMLATLTVTAIAQSDEPADSAPGRFVVPFNGDTLARVAVAVFLAAVAEFLVDGLVSPAFDKFGLDKFWLRYIAWGVASGVVALSAVNLFDGYIPSALVGQALTAVFCGGGSNKIHDFFDRYVSKKSESMVNHYNLYAQKVKEN